MVILEDAGHFALATHAGPFAETLARLVGR
jgi:hypothetical protein